MWSSSSMINRCLGCMLCLLCRRDDGVEHAHDLRCEVLDGAAALRQEFCRPELQASLIDGPDFGGGVDEKRCAGECLLFPQRRHDSEAVDVRESQIESDQDRLMFCAELKRLLSGRRMQRSDSARLQ